MPRPDLVNEPGAPTGGGRDPGLAAVEAGLDALDAPAPASQGRRGWRRTLSAALPPLLALVAFVAVWQALWASALWPEYKLPAPLAVWNVVWEAFREGEALGILWTSVHRAVIGFLVAVVVATPFGLLVARVRPVRSAIGPLVTGLQSLPSVAWVPAAVLWFGLNDAAIYFVVLLGAVPSITNGLVAGIEQIPPILPRVGAALGANRWESARHILLPAALPGYLAGLKQGWAFSWRSLMAAELIAVSPQLGLGLGAFLQHGQALSDMTQVIAAILLILLVGIGVELLAFRPVERRVLRARGLVGVL
ncbi:ABC transporter permease [Streptoalloteichus hindustanus]|uniref:NitT/TauT family transport system permease protein n=1 Tax=Streptoalloteichus hindustanus TaxID=2017 RepID=A0A1M5BKF1_STRHI|nr:ABC transporter permease [Streptoalloteichus hindustanus]SHF42830.1 NitT/TauT family transport system permease protein [Streptoalloteichus hindustanus]